ncbi:3-oxoacyl-[acyl-carrier-protein] synthase II, chloroplastic-like [Zingiber officinale]|uniref:3-oxoacyl-[acyl-carrier-protein] synthase II, chloroplastic-like n=1 Tax=Zingiber officinale TaxID=94328 RepID=UPI001C4C249F|nr:3-oxoacyl-[acyl-carrier-protein] synthase II, chloroplastic-like [Zingiber officinale]
MAGAAVASPLCAWIAAAACLSSSSSPATARSDQTRRGARRVGAGPRRSRCFPAAAIPSGGLRGSGIHSLLRSYLAFEPCPDFYRSCGVDGHGNRSSLIGPWKADVHRRRPRMSAASGKLITVALGSAKELVGNKNLRRVVVTGMGVVTPLGHDPDIFYNNLLEGISGISEIEAFDCSSYPTRIAGEIKSFSTDGWVAPKLVKRMDNFMLYLLTAAKKALEDGGVTEEVMSQFEKTKCGVLIGSALGGMKIFNDALEALRVSYKKISPFSVPLATTNMGSAMLAIDLGWMGPNYSISTACATSNFCILNAANHIIRGEADVMLCGGSDAAIIPIGLGGFVACKALSQRNNDPQKASRPWDVDRDGFVIGEGAGVLLLEELEHAKQRGAKIYAEFLGGSFTCDAYHVTEPHPEGRGIILCIENALSESGVCREDVNYVNAHATSTPFGDLKEYQVLSHCFGSNPELKVNSTKSMIGHLLGAAGAVEAVAVVQAIRTGWVHPNINLDNPEESVDVDRLVSSRKERLDVKVALSNSFGFGGHNSAILLAPYK